MENGVAGFRIEGTWGEIVAHGERVSQALRSLGVPSMDEGVVTPYAECLAQWEVWRPKHGEELDEEVSERTAEQASVSEGQGEQAGVGVREDIRNAGRKLDEAVERLSREGFEEAMDAVGESVNHASRAADTAGRRAMRAVEDSLYEHVMTSISPYYFDNELVSANISRVPNGVDTYIFEINVNDDQLKEAVAEMLETADDASADG